MDWNERTEEREEAARIKLIVNTLSKFKKNVALIIAGILQKSIWRLLMLISRGLLKLYLVLIIRRIPSDIHLHQQGCNS